jgi:hypothetical protein
MRLTEPCATHSRPRRLTMPRLTFAALAAAMLALVGCSGGEPDEEEFDRAAYCDAMHGMAPSIDADAMREGDAAAHEEAIQTYTHLAGLAPDELRHEWQVIITGVSQIVREAGGEDAATDREAAEFRQAYQTVYSDYIDSCLEVTLPGG